MKTSLGDDCVAINLDYEAVKEVVQIVPDCPGDYASARLRTRERHENFTLRFCRLCSPTHPAKRTRHTMAQAKLARFTVGSDDVGETFPVQAEAKR